MDMPKGKGPRLPPKPTRAGAAARLRRFELERGLGSAPRLPAAVDTGREQVRPKPSKKSE